MCVCVCVCVRVRVLEEKTGDNDNDNSSDMIMNTTYTTFVSFIPTISKHEKYVYSCGWVMFPRDPIRVSILRSALSHHYAQ